MHNRAGNHANVPTHAEMRFLSMVFVILACLLNAKPEIKSLVSAESPVESVEDSADANATYEVFYQQAVNCFRSVSSHLTWRLAFNSTFRPLFSLPSNEFKTGMKRPVGQVNRASSDCNSNYSKCECLW